MILNLDGKLAWASSKAVRKKSSDDPFAPWAARTCWTARMVWTARMEVIGPGRTSGRSLQPRIYKELPGIDEWHPQ